jgi:hypothetical protein
LEATQSAGFPRFLDVRRPNGARGLFLEIHGPHPGTVKAPILVFQFDAELGL